MPLSKGVTLLNALGKKNVFFPMILDGYVGYHRKKKKREWVGVLKSEMPIRKGVFIFRMPCFLWKNASLNSKPFIYIRNFNWCFMTTCISKSFPFSRSKCKFPAPFEIFKNTMHPPNTLGNSLE
jgi:hypothetical protein